MSSNSSGIPPSPPPVTVPTPASGGVVVTVPAAPPALAILSRGATVEARVSVPAEGGMAVLSAVIEGETVEIPVRLPAALPVGTELTLKVTQPGEAATLRLTAINGRPPALAMADAGMSSSAVSAQAQAPDAAAVVVAATTVGVGRPVPALVLQGDVMRDGQAQGGAEALAPGTRLVVRLTQFTLPDAVPRGAAASAAAAPSAVAPSAVVGKAAAASAAVAPSAASAKAATASVAPALPGATPGPASAVVGEAAARYAAIGRFAGAAPLPGAPAAVPGASAFPSAATPVPGSNPAASAPAVPSSPAASGGSPAAAPAPGAPPAAATPGVAMPASLSGLVISRSALGQPTVQTPAGFVALDVRAPLPNGTQVSFDILSRTLPEAGAPSPLAFGATAASPWTTLEALWQSLSLTDPEAAARLAAALPQAGPQLLANLTAAMAAVRGGDASAWLGVPDIAQRAQSREDTRVAKLAQRLTDDLKGAARGANRAEGEWRVYPLPFVAGGQVERIQMLVRRAPNADDAEGGGKRGGRRDTRFLLDLTLSRLGEMQIDGLVNAAAHNLDLVIRTRQDLPAPMPADLRGLFAEALLAVNYTGVLSFRVTQDFVLPLPADDAAAHPGVVV